MQSARVSLSSSSPVTSAGEITASENPPHQNSGATIKSVALVLRFQIRHCCTNSVYSIALLPSQLMLQRIAQLFRRRSRCIHIILLERDSGTAIGISLHQWGNGFSATLYDMPAAIEVGE